MVIHSVEFAEGIKQFTRSPRDYASSALCALNTRVTAKSSTLNFLSRKDKTRLCGYNLQKDEIILDKKYMDNPGLMDRTYP